MGTSAHRRYINKAAFFYPPRLDGYGRKTPERDDGSEYRRLEIETSRFRDEEMSKGKEVMAPTTSLDNTKNLYLYCLIYISCSEYFIQFIFSFYASIDR